MKQIHGKETHDINMKISFVKDKTKAAEKDVAFAENAYKSNYAVAVKEVKQIQQSLEDIEKFTIDTVEAIEQDKTHSENSVFLYIAKVESVQHIILLCTIPLMRYKHF